MYNTDFLSFSLLPRNEAINCKFKSALVWDYGKKITLPQLLSSTGQDCVNEILISLTFWGEYQYLITFIIISSSI